MERNERTLSVLVSGALFCAAGLGHDLAHTYAPMWRTFSLVLVAALVLPSALAALRPR